MDWEEEEEGRKENLEQEKKSLEYCICSKFVSEERKEMQERKGEEK